MTGYSVELANSYITGNGADLDPIKGLQILTMLALKDNDKKAISELSDHYYIGDCINKDTERALQLQNLSGGQLDKYKAGNALEFKKPVKKPTNGIFEEEERHLEAVINEIQDDIRGKEKNCRFHIKQRHGVKKSVYIERIIRIYHIWNRSKKTIIWIRSKEIERFLWKSEN